MLKGSVLQAHPAHMLHRNGQLRIVFHQVVPPQSAGQQVEASLEGVEVKDDQNLSLDSEGGAQATTPKTRYLTTGISIALAATTFLPDDDAGAPGQSVGEIGGRPMAPRDFAPSASQWARWCDRGRLLPHSVCTERGWQCIPIFFRADMTWCVRRTRPW